MPNVHEGEAAMVHVAQVQDPDTGQLMWFFADTEAGLDAALDAELEEPVAL